MKTIILLILISVMVKAQTTYDVGQTNANITLALSQALAQPDSNTVYRDAINTKLNKSDSTTGYLTPSDAASAYQSKDTDLDNPDIPLNAVQDSLTAKANTAWFAIVPALIDDSIAVKMNRSEMTGYSPTSHTHTIANITGLQDSLNKFAEIGDLGGSGTDSATVISLVHDVLDSLNETNGYYVSRVESFSGSSVPMVINPQDSGDILIIVASGLIPTGWQNGDDIRLFYGTTDDIITSLATPSTGSQDIFISLFGYVTVDDTADVNFGLYQAGNGDLIQSSTVITLKRNTIRTYVDTLSLSWGILDTVLTGSLPGWKVPNDITITEISAYTDANTCTFNIEERAETTPNSAGTDVIGSDLVADTNQEETSTFTNATIAKNTWLVPTISATGDVSIFTISVRYIKTD